MDRTIDEHLQHNYKIVPQSVEKLKQGILNNNFRIRTTEGEFLLKQYTEREVAEVQWEMNILQFLARHHYPCPEVILAQNGDTVFIIDGKPAVLLRFIRGESLTDMNLSTAHLIGELVGKLHVLLMNYKQSVQRERWEPDDIRQHLNTSSFEPKESFMCFTKSELGMFSFPPDLPTGITHQDVKPDNIIVNDDEISIIDFDNSYHGVLLYDVMTTIIWTCFDVEHQPRTQIIDAYLRGYECQRKLLEVEKEYFFDALRFRLLREAFVWPFRNLDPNRSSQIGARFQKTYQVLANHKTEIEDVCKKLQVS